MFWFSLPLIINSWPLKPVKVNTHLAGSICYVIFQGFPFVVSVQRTLWTFRFDYGYEIEYKHDFSNLVCVVSITACQTNLVSRVFLPAVKQQEGARVLGM